LTSAGFVYEVFSSYQGEGGSVPGSCMGKRQIFVRLAGCNLSSGEMGTDGCVFCDSPRAKEPNPGRARFEVDAGRRNFNLVANPVKPGALVDAVKALITPDTHSVSLTGGEPLAQEEFIRHVVTDLKEDGMGIYLETNGPLSWTSPAWT
jgi:organic radical activating enzyme